MSNKRFDLDLLSRTHVTLNGWHLRPCIQSTYWPAAMIHTLRSELLVVTIKTTVILDNLKSQDND